MVYDTTRVGGGFGGRRYLTEVQYEFQDDIRRPTSEFDLPVEQRTNILDASLTLALGWRNQLSARYSNNRAKIRGELVEAGSVAERLNSERHTGSIDLVRRLSSRTDGVVEGYFERIDFEDATRDADSYGMRFGFDFASSWRRRAETVEDVTSGISGQLLLGFRNLAPQDPTRPDFIGLTGDVDVRFTTSDLNRLGVTFTRDYRPSIFEDNWYFIETRAGAYFRWQVIDRLVLQPGASFGDNRYPLPRLIEDEDGNVTEQRIQDEHFLYSLLIDVNVRPGWFVGVTAEYFDRRSNLGAFQKDRLQVYLNLSLRL